jgi:Polyketide cyclase / dehydrase and lipid transport
MSKRVEGDIIIWLPVEEVFDFCADGRNEPRYNPRMTHAEQTSTGLIGLGSQFRAEMRTMGRKVAMTIEWTAYERPRRLASWTRLSGMDIRGDLRFDPVAGGTRMRWAWALEPHGGVKLMGPMITLMGRRQERTIWTSLKRVLEAPETSVTPA